MGNSVRLHSLIKSSSTNRTFSWMLISHLHLCSCVCPPHHYTSLPLLSSLLTCQPLRSLPSPSAASLLFHVVICHQLSKPRAPVLPKVRLQRPSSLELFGRDQLGQTTLAQVWLLRTNKILETLPYRIFQIASRFYAAYDHMCMSFSAHANWSVHIKLDAPSSSLKSIWKLSSFFPCWELLENQDEQPVILSRTCL